MNLLTVSSILPGSAWGASARNYYLLKALARQHTVSLLALANRTEMEAYDSIPRLEKLARRVRIIPCPLSRGKRWQQLLSAVLGKSYILNQNKQPAMQDALDAMLADDRYDAVLFENVLTAGYRLPAGVRIIIDQHNIEHELLQRTYRHERAFLRKWYNWQESRLIRRVELERCARADIVVVTSERERIVLQSLLPESAIAVVPNGVDVEMFNPRGNEQDVVPGRIIFTGTMDYYPNTDAVLFFARQCWPSIKAQVPGATWEIVGRNPPPAVRRLAALPNVTVSGTVPDVRPYLAQAAVAIAPLQIAGGTRLKILEALAMKKAVVSTSVGFEGLSTVPGKHLLAADEPEAFAQAVVTFLHHPEMRTAFGTAGRALAETEYSWESCGEHLVHSLEEKIRIC